MGMNDAADPSRIAHLGDTRGPLGMNDGAALSPPASILQIRTVAAVSTSGKVKVPRHLKIRLPKTKETVMTHSSGVTGGGRFEIHYDGVDKVGALIARSPDVKVTFDKTANLYKVVSITIHTLKVVNNPAPRALPVVGTNVTNDRSKRVRTPADDADGKGYWKDVIKNMEGYQYGGDPNKHPPDLQWYAKGSTEYHEEVHNQQFRSWMKQNNGSVLLKIEKNVGNVLKGVSNARLTEKTVAIAVKNYLLSSIRSGSAGSHTDEKEAYTKTYKKIWVPVIKKISADAGNAGWK
jgi:hypothetical protein